MLNRIKVETKLTMYTIIVAALSIKGITSDNYMVKLSCALLFIICLIIVFKLRKKIEL